jgi:hypothetical protein
VLEPHRLASLGWKVFQQGFYWPTTLSDVEYLVKTCDAC